MSTEIQVMFDDKQLNIIKNDICKGATDEELEYFLNVCKRSGLDPFARQIYSVKRPDRKLGRDVRSIQTGIDGYRLIAHRTDKCAGIDDPIFDNEKEPNKATVTVWRFVQGVRSPFTATARWNEYYPGKDRGFIWDSKPCIMLGKCAEALAIRKAFPAEVSGLYVKEEMDQVVEEVQKVNNSSIVTQLQITRLWAIANTQGWPHAKVHFEIKHRWNLETTKELTQNQYDELVRHIQSFPVQKEISQENSDQIPSPLSPPTLLKAFEEIGYDQEKVERVLGKKAVDWTPEDCRAIKQRLDKATNEIRKNQI